MATESRASGWRRAARAGSNGASERKRSRSPRTSACRRSSTVRNGGVSSEQAFAVAAIAAGARAPRRSRPSNARPEPHELRVRHRRDFEEPLVVRGPERRPDIDRRLRVPLPEGESDEWREVRSIAGEVTPIAVWPPGFSLRMVPAMWLGASPIGAAALVLGASYVALIVMVLLLAAEAGRGNTGRRCWCSPSTWRWHRARWRR